MSRHNGSSLPALVQLASKLPWWLSVLLAIASGWYLHSVAVGPVPVNALRSDEMLIGSAFKGMAQFGQYLVPGLFIGGAIGSFVGRYKRRTLRGPETQNKQPPAPTAPAPEPVAEVVQRVEPEPFVTPESAPVIKKAAEPKAPACPHCKKTMAIKVARTGPNAGGNFWGCQDYPKCRGIRAIFAPMKV